MITEQTIPKNWRARWLTWPSWLLDYTNKNGQSVQLQTRLCGGLTFNAKTIPTSKQPNIAATEIVNAMDTSFERFLP